MTQKNIQRSRKVNDETEGVKRAMKGSGQAEERMRRRLRGGVERIS